MKIIHGQEFSPDERNYFKSSMSVNIILGLKDLADYVRDNYKENVEEVRKASSSLTTSLAPFLRSRHGADTGPQARTCHAMAVRTISHLTYLQMQHIAFLDEADPYNFVWNKKAIKMVRRARISPGRVALEASD
jgi:hypothetical protein